MPAEVRMRNGDAHEMFRRHMHDCRWRGGQRMSWQCGLSSQFIVFLFACPIVFPKQPVILIEQRSFFFVIVRIQLLLEFQFQL